MNHILKKYSPMPDALYYRRLNPSMVELLLLFSVQLWKKQAL